MVVLRFQLLAVPGIQDWGCSLNIYEYKSSVANIFFLEMARRWHHWLWKVEWKLFCWVSPFNLIAHPASEHLDTHVTRVLARKKENLRMMRKISSSCQGRLFTSGHLIIGCLSRSFVLPSPTKQEREERAEHKEQLRLTCRSYHPKTILHCLQ